MFVFRVIQLTVLQLTVLQLTVLQLNGLRRAYQFKGVCNYNGICELSEGSTMFISQSNAV